MNFQRELNRYISDLQEFDLEVFFHDDTFIDMLEYREFLEKNIEKLTAQEARELLYLDQIVVSYYNLYKYKKLVGYKRLSFKVLEKIEKISRKYIDGYMDEVA